ncbi:hypothetical protein [Bradyrhizobium sp. LeoA1S1]
MTEPLIAFFDAGYLVIDIVRWNGQWAAWMTDQRTEVLVRIPDSHTADEAASNLGRIVATEQVRRGKL